MTLYPIFSRRIAYILERQGFKLINIAPNRKHQGFKVYYFEETTALRNAAAQLIQDTKQS